MYILRGLLLLQRYSKTAYKVLQVPQGRTVMEIKEKGAPQVFVLSISSMKAANFPHTREGLSLNSFKDIYIKIAKMTEFGESSTYNLGRFISLL